MSTSQPCWKPRPYSRIICGAPSATGTATAVAATAVRIRFHRRALPYARRLAPIEARQDWEGELRQNGRMTQSRFSTGLRRLEFPSPRIRQVDSRASCSPPRLRDQPALHSERRALKRSKGAAFPSSRTRVAYGFRVPCIDVAARLAQQACDSCREGQRPDGAGKSPEKDGGDGDGNVTRPRTRLIRAISGKPRSPRGRRSALR